MKAINCSLLCNGLLGPQVRFGCWLPPAKSGKTSGGYPSFRIGGAEAENGEQYAEFQDYNVLSRLCEGTRRNRIDGEVRTKYCNALPCIMQGIGNKALDFFSKTEILG